MRLDCGKNRRIFPLPMRAACFLLLFAAATAVGGPPVARFQSPSGDFDVLLDPDAAPRSVTNFTAYANRGAYDNSIIHRSTTYNPAGLQIVQGGGYQLAGNSLNTIATDPPIPLEAGVANTRGTLAMARTAAPDSATSQWYFNVADNPGLDFNYAVFGRVLGGGMSALDRIGALTVYNVSAQLGAAFSELPLLAPALEAQNLVVFGSVRVEPFAITNLTRAGGFTELRWSPLSTNTPVRVERAPAPGGPWSTAAAGVTGGFFRETDATNSRVFYRLATE